MRGREWGGGKNIKTVRVSKVERQSRSTVKWNF